MYRRDYLLNEALKFAQLLAKLMGLKAEGQHEEFTKEFDNALQSEYDLELEELLGLTEDDFKIRLANMDYSPEKLNALSQLLYVFAQPFTATEDTVLMLKKVLAIFDTLEQNHHFDSFENVEKRNIIYRFLNTIYEQP